MSAALLVEMLAAAMGLLGTALLAIKCRWSGWGFAAYLVSNAGWIWFAIGHGHWALFWQQVGFTVFSLVGVWQWLVAPILDAALDVALDGMDLPPPPLGVPRAITPVQFTHGVPALPRTPPTITMLSDLQSGTMTVVHADWLEIWGRQVQQEAVEWATKKRS